MLRLTCVAIVSLSACARSTPAPTPPLAPAEVVIPALVEATRGPGLVPYVDELYALGWSADGRRFAYAIERADEACGCLTVDLHIASSTGEPLWWSDHYRSDELGSLDALNFPELWARRGAEWTAALRARGITQAPTSTLTPLPIGGAAVPRFEIATTAVGDDAEVGFAHLTSYEVGIVRGDVPESVARFDAGDGLGPLAVTVAGYIEAPDQDHAVAIIVETWRGWEGQQQVETVRVAPASR
ncbi:MAG: hypothetical protein JNK64_09570 [Myxococcales bacterium]|nr:hypothetical protein [Myxococcales bacterium]